MASSHDDVTQPAARGVERRTILKAAAWTVPTIVVATASPAAATASGTKFAVSASGKVTAVGLGVRFTVTFGGTSPGPHDVTFTQVTIPGSTLTISINTSRNIPPGNPTVQFTVLSVNLAGLSGQTAILSYSIPDHGSGTIPALISANSASTAEQSDKKSADEDQPPEKKTPPEDDATKKETPDPSPSPSN
jgi:hypothetical protein